VRGVRAFTLDTPASQVRPRIVLVPQDLAQHEQWAALATHNDWQMHAPCASQAT
jgi:hypothetical protein